MNPQSQYTDDNNISDQPLESPQSSEAQTPKSFNDFRPLKKEDEPTKDSQNNEYNSPSYEEAEAQIDEETEKGSDNPEDAQLLSDLKDDRDKLRGITEDRESKKSKKILKISVGILLTIALLSLIGVFILKSLDHPEQTIERQTFSVPSDISSKSTDEQAAINIIDLARKGNSEEIIVKWLGTKDLSTSKEDFQNLIASYANSADGQKVELIEKKVGKTNLGVAGAEEVQAVSIIYKSAYFEHPNSIYTKINLYEPVASPGTWKLYLFEFKAQEGNERPSADLSV